MLEKAFQYKIFELPISSRNHNILYESDFQFISILNESVIKFDKIIKNERKYVLMQDLIDPVNKMVDINKIN